MKKNVKAIGIALLVAPIVCGFLVGPCCLTAEDFVQINENGFDPVDNAEDGNHYAWSMTNFLPDGASENERQVYVGTGNNISDLIQANFDVVFGEPFDNTLVRPPEIWRSMVMDDLPVWEKIFDYRDVEAGPLFNTVGFRFMTTYAPPSKNGTTYIYASTYGVNPSLWRSASGDYGTWEQVWEADIGGSIRWMQVLDGILYFAPTQELILADLAIAELWATDGDTFWPVMQDGFGNPNNKAIACLNAFNGWLYAGVVNYVDGAEIWRIQDIGSKTYDVQRVVANGGSDARNEIFGSSAVFGDHIYFGTLIFSNLNRLSGNFFKGGDIIRIDADDNWETIVGENGRSEWGSGFDYALNGYIWQLEAHEGWLYAGTWDLSSGISRAFREVGLCGFIDLVRQFLRGEQPTLPFKEGPKVQPALIDRILHAGGDLYKSPDGIHWDIVTTTGLGDPANSGFRTMRSIGPFLYVGFANPTDGLEVWRAPARLPQ